MNLKRSVINAFIVVLALITVCLLVYLIYNYWYLPWQIEKDNARYAALYVPEDDIGNPSPAPESPTPTAEMPPVADITAEPVMPVVSEAAITPSPSPEATQPVLVTEATLSPTDPVTETVPEDIKLGTPGPDTIMYLSATMPPVQESFNELISMNPDTVGFLTLGEKLALPVVQRINDNSYYLGHDFEGNESDAGCLFVDGVNRLYPADECIFIYGHNMKNGTMFGRLDRMETAKGLATHYPARFDTIYGDGVYVPFACFTLSGDESDRGYFQLRRFEFDEESYTDFVTALKKRSTMDIPVDAVYGDKLLILVTCNYSINDGRFVVAFRQLREGETEAGARRLIELAVPK